MIRSEDQYNSVERVNEASKAQNKGIVGHRRCSETGGPIEVRRVQLAHPRQSTYHRLDRTSGALEQQSETDLEGKKGKNTFNSREIEKNSH